MKKKKIVVISVIILILILLVSTLLILSKHKESDSKDSNNKNTLVATISYSKYEGVDAGEEHVYEIYSKGKKEYRYIYRQYQITIAGPQESKKQNGVLRNKRDLNKISKKHSKLSVNIIYYDGNESINYSTIKELSKELF